MPSDSSANLHGYEQKLNAGTVWEDFKEHNFIWTQWKKMRHFAYLKAPIVPKKAIENKNSKDPGQMNTSPTISSTLRAHPNAPLQNENGQRNISNDWRIYAKMECNHHLANKFALFYHMNAYYKSIGRDPFDVLPLTFHVGQG